jgi:hypothetical protein
MITLRTPIVTPPPAGAGGSPLPHAGIGTAPRVAAGIAALAVAAVTCALTPAAAVAADAEARSVVALGPDSTLVLFTTANPKKARVLKLRGAARPLLAIDARPADGKLYGLDDEDGIVTISLPDGVVTPVVKLKMPFGGGEASGFDFNPQADRLRIVGPSGQNLRVSLPVGAVAMDGKLAFGAGDPQAGRTPAVTAVAYTNAYDKAPTTVMFDIDAGADVLLRQDPPNDGVLQTVGPLGVDCGAAAGFDIVSPRAGVDEGYAVCGTTLYRVNLESGRLSAVGPIGAPVARYLSLAVLPSVTQ